MATTLGLVSVASAGGTVVVLTRWWTHRRDALGRERPLPVISASLLMVLALVAALPAAHRRVLEHRLGMVGGALAGRHVTVHCQTTTGALVDMGNELGFVRFGPDGTPEAQTLIKHEQCSLLSKYLAGDRKAPSLAEVIAVHVLTHESMHMAGQTSESRAECEAVQRDARTARLLGASATAASRLAATYLRTVYPRMPEEYVTPDCRAGGPLDEHLEPSVFGP